MSAARETPPDVTRFGAARVYLGWVLVAASALPDLERSGGDHPLVTAGVLAAIVVAVCGALSGGWRLARDLLALVALPAWGLSQLADLVPGCDVTVTMGAHDARQVPSAFRPLAAPWVYDLLALHLAACAAYVAALRSPGGLPRLVELLVRAHLLAATGVHVAVVAQAMSAFSPVATHFDVALERYGVGLGGLLASGPAAVRFVAALAARPRLARPAAVVSEEPVSLAAAYREAPPGAPAPAPPRAWTETLLVTLAVIAAYGALTAAAHGRLDAAVEPFSASCGYVFSRRPVRWRCTDLLAGPSGSTRCKTR